jgi:hypothetical protein
MTDRPLSKAEFDQVLACALRLEELREQGISPDRAAQVASELGISPTSWDAAIQAVKGEQSPNPMSYLLGAWRRPTILALLTFAFGALWSVLKGPDAPGENWDVPVTVLMVGIALGIGVRHLRRNNPIQYLRDLVGYWAGFPFGLAVGFGGDGLWFSLTAWTLCAVVGLIASRRGSWRLLPTSAGSPGGAP